MKEKTLRKALIENGFVKDEKGQLIKSFDDIELAVSLDSGMFFNLSMINIYYNYKQEIPYDEDVLENIWKKGESAINDKKTGLILGALDTRWICGTVMDKKNLKDVSVEAVEKYCEQFVKAIKPIIKKHEL